MQEKIVTITVNDEKEIKCRAGSILFQVLCDEGYIFAGNCGGRGMCQRCKVYDNSREMDIRSCEWNVTEDMNISIPQTAMDILVTYGDDASGICVNTEYTSDTDRPLGVAVDLGTTTVAMELVDIGSGDTLGIHSFLNPQIAFGSDVISRIRAGSSREGLADLRSSIMSRLSEGIACMLSDYADGKEEDNPLYSKLSAIVISGNTTMLSILENLTLENLGQSPFNIKNPDTYSACGADFFEDGKFADCNVTCLPNLSAFVGADALCGALIRGVGTGKEYELFADLGTNGEMILAREGTGFATSCACGPAFEGMLRKSGVHGSNAFDMLTMLKASGKISDEGVLADRYIEKGYPLSNGVTVDMDMIRSFLLAKAAIGAGIESLMATAGINASDVKCVHIAGGFGCNLSLSSAISLGLFPTEFANNSVYAGNTSLKGAHRCLIDRTFIDKINGFKTYITAVNLGELDGFDKRYYSHMNLRSWSMTL